MVYGFVSPGDSVDDVKVIWAGARYTKWIASLELRHKEHNNDSYPLHNNTIDFTQKNETIVHILTWYIEHHPETDTSTNYMPSFIWKCVLVEE